MPQVKKTHFESQVLVALRKSKDWKQDRLATEVGVNAKTIWNWENRKTTPGDNKIKKLCEIFEVDSITFASVVVLSSQINFVTSMLRGGDSPEKERREQTDHLLGVAEKLHALPVATKDLGEEEESQDNPFSKPARGG